MDAKLVRIKKRLKRVDKKLGDIAHNLQGVRQDISSLYFEFITLNTGFNVQMRTYSRWLFSVCGGGFGGLAILMAHGFHWL